MPLTHLVFLSVVILSQCQASADEVETTPCDFAHGLAAAYIRYDSREVDFRQRDFKAVMEHLNEDARSRFAGDIEAQRAHLGAFEGILVRRVQDHPCLESLNLGVMCDEKRLKPALVHHLRGTKGPARLKELGLDIEVFAVLLQHADFLEAFQKCYTFRSLNLYNILISTNEGQVCRALKILKTAPQVRNLGLYDLSQDPEFSVKMRLTPDMVGCLNQRGFETLTLAHLDITECGEAFCEYFLGRLRPRFLKIIGNVYCRSKDTPVLCQSLEASHGVSITLGGQFFVCIQGRGAHAATVELPGL
ncbi:MAG: hypothetical protein LCH26_00210 [Proteobacteria bacterium]|nr:hypothetical protein [Pseudomonadota bacterium]